MVRKNNALIRKNVEEILRKKGIKRVNSEVFFVLEHYFSSELDRIVDGLKEEIAIQGRKTLKKEDVKKVLERMKEEEELDLL
tara:strand:- start:5829 stop:6074 length:246 start_codon:yes stop_codon:yes gene_type:complete